MGSAPKTVNEAIREKYAKYLERRKKKEEKEGGKAGKAGEKVGNAEE